MTSFTCSSLRCFFRRCLAGAAVLTLSGNLQAGLSPLKLSASFAPEAGVGTSVTLRVNGAEGQIYEVQSSEDLKDWSSVGLGQLHGGELRFEQFVPASRTRRYYRAARVMLPSPVPFQVLAGSGLSVSVDPGTLSFPGNDPIAVPGGDVMLKPNSVNHIGIDLFDFSLHAFTRKIHSGAVFLADVTTDAEGIIQIDAPRAVAARLSRVPKAQAAIRAGNSLNVLLIGDSLTQGAGASFSNIWSQLLFGDKARSSRWNLLPLDPQLKYANAAAGGNTVLYGMSLVGTAIGPNGAGWATDHPDQAIFRTLYNDARLVSQGQLAPESFPSPFLSNPPDLLVIGFGANAISDEAVYLETIIREFRSRGTEVILLTSNRRFDGNTPMLANEELLQLVSDNQACAIADTYDYVEEANRNGIPTYADEVHQNDEGQRRYAAAIRSVLNDLKQEADPLQASPNRITLATPNFFPPGRFPTATLVQCFPNADTGSRTNARDPGLSLPVVLGRAGHAAAVTHLTTGQWATYAGSRVLAVDLIVENLPGENGVLRVSTGFDAYTVKSVPVYGALSPMQVFRILSYQEVHQIPNNASFFNREQNGAASVGLRLTCVEGLVRVAGVVFHTYKGFDVPFESMTFSGNWGSERSALDLPAWRYTDSISDTVTIPFRGNGVEVWLHAGAAAGRVNVLLNGAPAKTAIELYQPSGTAPLLYSLKIFPGLASLDQPVSSLYGNYVLQVRLDGVNASTGAVSPQQRRLALYGAQALDTR
jgi:lysophospholipase L1-like esterase